MPYIPKGRRRKDPDQLDLFNDTYLPWVERGGKTEMNDRPNSRLTNTIYLS
jgi:hypothetical protein